MTPEKGGHAFASTNRALAATPIIPKESMHDAALSHIAQRAATETLSPWGSA
jgi:hypothetical protein